MAGLQAHDPTGQVVGERMNVDSGHRRMGALSKAMVTLLIVSAVLLGFSALSEFSISAYLIGFDDLSQREKNTTAAEITDIEAALGGVWILYLLIGFIPLAVLFIVWAWRATKNLQHFRVTLRRKPGWAIGGWFIPVGNFWIPYQTIRDAWTKLPGSVRNDRATSKVWLWAWVLWMITGVLSSPLERTSPDTAGEWLGYYFANGLLSLTGVASCVLAAVAVASISSAQDQTALLRAQQGGETL